MRPVSKTVVAFLCVSIAVSAADHPEFRAKPASSYPHKQTSENVTIAIEQYETDEQAKEPFGKLNPYRHGVLPVLVVIQNNGKDTLKLDRIKLTYVLPDRTKIENTPASEVRYLDGVRRPTAVNAPLGGVKVFKSKQNPLSDWTIEGRAFSAPVLPPGQSASGFFYFQTSTSAAATLYISGLTHAGSGEELFYFEIPVK